MPVDPTSVNWDACALEKITEMVSRRVCADGAAGATIVQTQLRKGAIVALHTHAGEQWLRVSQGAVAVRMRGQVVTLSEDETLTIPANTPHQLEALEDSVVVDVRHGEPNF